MAGLPQRDVPKTSITLRIDTSVLASVQNLLVYRPPFFTSRSELIETIFFFSQSLYVSHDDESFIAKLISLRAKLTALQLTSPEPCRCSVHSTIDTHAVEFVDMLVSRYKPAFKNRSELAELLLFNVGDDCGTLKNTRYYLERFIDVFDSNPSRKRRRSY